MASSESRDPAQTDAEVANLIQAVREDLMAPGIGEGVGPHGIGRVYDDTATPPNPTIGWGANLNVPYNQQFLEQQGYDIHAVIDGRQSISEEHAKQLLDLDVGHALADARATFPNFDTLDPNAQQALTEMSFNLGYPALHGDADHHGFPSLQNDLAQVPPDYAAAAGEVHVQNIGDARNEHYHDLMSQAAADQREAPAAFHEQPAHSHLFGWSETDPFAAAMPHDFTMPQAVESAPALSDQIQLPAGLLNTDFGTGGITPANHDHQSAMPDSFEPAPVAAAHPDPVSEPPTGFLSGIQDFFGSFSPAPIHAETPDTQPTWGAPNETAPVPEAVTPSLFDQVSSAFSPTTPAHEDAPSVQDHGSPFAASHHDTGFSFGSIFGGGESHPHEFTPSYESAHPHDSGPSHHDSGYSHYDSGSSHHDSGASAHDSGSHDAGGHSGGGHDADGSHSD